MDKKKAQKINKKEQIQYQKHKRAKINDKTME